tara:strand:- start:463 stop:756 length:294 start_codon:yes stop_codon:yes gene_type:complete
MNTKSFNYFRNTFALIGFYIIACSVADEPSVEPEPPVQSNIGKYQIAIAKSLTSSGNAVARRTLVVLNTETGTMKTYGENGSGWVEHQSFPTITFTH